MKSLIWLIFCGAAVACAPLFAGCEGEDDDEDYQETAWFGTHDGVWFKLYFVDNGAAKYQAGDAETIPGTHREESGHVLAEFPTDGGAITFDLSLSADALHMTGTMVDADGHRHSVSLVRPDLSDIH